MPEEFNPLGQPIGVPVPHWKGALEPERERLTGHFCCLEKLDPASHEAALWEAFSKDVDGALWTYLPCGPFAGLPDFSSWLQSTAQRKDAYFYAIRDLGTGRAVGLASYLRINPADGSIEVGNLCFGPELQRTPAATESMYLMMKYAFELGYRRYEWKCNALNEPSRRAALRLGFQYEGTFRQAMVVKGRNRDTAWFSILDSEWPRVRAALEAWLAPENFDEAGRQRHSLAQLRPAQR